MAGAQFPESAGNWLERGVGVSLIVLGVWVGLGARSLHTHRHAHEGGIVHAHLHSHLPRRDHAQGHTVTAVGALHGLAGVAPLVALLPISGVHSPWGAGVFLILFAIGTALGMGMYALLAGWIAGRAALRSAGLARGVSVVTGAATIAIGMY